MITRRTLLKGTAAACIGMTGLGGYANAQSRQLTVTSYGVTPPNWPTGQRLRVALIADLHACEPWMGETQIRTIVAHTNALAPDAILLLGDYVAGHKLARLSRPMAASVWATALAELKAPCGVHAVLGNHDWWHDRDVQQRRAGPVSAGLALEAVGIPVYENRAVRLSKDGHPFWIAGLGDQWAFWPRGVTKPPRRISGYEGVDDLPATLAGITDDAPVILMAHEPDIFPQVPARVALTVCGHTHGGQVTVAGFAPVVPSRYGRRFVYGHIVENERHLVVSGGLGCSAVPVRLGRPPEIVIVELGGTGGIA